MGPGACRCAVGARCRFARTVLQLCCVAALSRDNGHYSTNVRSSCQINSAVRIAGVCAYALWYSLYLRFSASALSSRTLLTWHVQSRLCQHGDKLFRILLYFNCSVYSIKPSLFPLSQPCSCSDISFLLAVCWCSSLQYSSTSDTNVFLCSNPGKGRGSSPRVTGSEFTEVQTK